MNAIPFVISLLGFMFLLQPTYAQKLLRTEYQMMFTEFPVLSDSLMTDKYRTSFYQVNDCGRWNFYSHGNTNARWRFQGKEKVLDFIIADTTKSSRQYWHYFSNPFAMDADSITFSADVLIGEGNQSQLLLKQKEDDTTVDIKPFHEWQNISITQPFDKSVDKEMMIAVAIGGNKPDTISLKNLKLLLDGKPIDECCPIPPANADHEFDTSSKFSFHDQPLTDVEVERFAMICKVWGLYKYRHPKVRAGEYDWNYQLFRMLPSALSAKSDKEFVKELMRWLPERTKEKHFTPMADSIVAQVHFNWIKPCKKEKKLYRRLVDLQEGGTNVPCYCLGYMQNSARLTYFYNETCYDSIPTYDDGYRMLGLFRFWNMMYYFHPYMYQMEEKWEQILPNYIRLFAAARDRKAFEEACVRITCELRDTHSDFYGCEKNRAADAMMESTWLPFDGVLKDDKFIITDFFFLPVDSCELQKGDVIIAVNHKPIAEIRKEKRNYNNLGDGSADQYAIYYTSFDGDSVVYTIERGDELMDVTIRNVYERYWEKRKEPEPSIHEPFRMLADSVLYLDVTQLNSEELRTQMKEMKDYKGIIFDMRGYPKEWTCSNTIASFLYPHPKALFYYTYADYWQPGIFRKNPNVELFGTENPDYYKGATVVLVNGLTMSAAEHVAATIGNAPNGYVIGEPTCGTLGRVLYVPFVSGVATRITGQGVYWPDGTCTYPSGVKIDKFVYPDPEAIRQGRDTMLEEAVKHITQSFTFSHVESY